MCSIEVNSDIWCSTQGITQHTKFLENYGVEKNSIDDSDSTLKDIKEIVDAIDGDPSTEEDKEIENDRDAVLTGNTLDVIKKV